jgi:hypothetical protein
MPTLTVEQYKSICQKVLVTPPFNNCSQRIVAEINRIIEEDSNKPKENN